MNEAALRAIARDRRMVTSELHEPNDYYGHATLLKTYVGLPPHRPLKAVIEHGPPTIGRWLWDADLASRLPTVLCASARRAREFTEAMPPHKKVLPIGPGLAYAPGGLAIPAKPTERRLLVFPVHSSHHYTAEFDIEAFGAAIEFEAADFDSVEVCLYWRDVLRGDARHYRERGFACSTAGHMYDARFLSRFRSIVARATAVATNAIGTHLLFAVLLERPTWLVGDMAQDPRVGFIDRDLDTAAFHDLTTAFERRAEAVTQRQRDLVAEFSGTEHVRAPAELREILAQAAERYRETVPFPRRLAAATRRQWLTRWARLRRWAV